jgi:hypothetical protein
MTRYCKKCEKETERCPDGRCRPCKVAYQARPAVRAKKSAYNHRPEVAVRIASYHTRPDVKARQAHLETIPENRARRFLLANTDCTSTLDDVAKAYASSTHAATGKPGEIGKGPWNLVMGHVHRGPIVGLIYAWENHVLTEAALGNWGALEQTMRLHMGAT